jgi:hypothetical protein
MANNYETRTFDEIVSTSLDLYMPTLADNIFKENPALYELKKKGCYVPASGGVQVIEPLMYGTNGTVKSYSRYETIDLSPQEGITSAIYPWTQIAGSVVIDGLSEFQNAGKAQLISLVGSKISQLEMSFQEKFNSFLFGAGRYNAAQTSKDPMGFLAAISETPDSYDVGGIDTSVCTWWQNKVRGNGSSAYTWFDSTSARATGIVDLTNLYNSCGKGTGGLPDIILCSQAFFENYETNLAVKKSLDIAQDQEAVAAGFANLKFRNATLYWDEQFATASCTTPTTTSAAIILNSKFLKIRYAADKNFKRTPWITPNNQDARSCMVLWYGNMTVSNRRKLGVMVDANVTEIA